MPTTAMTITISPSAVPMPMLPQVALTWVWRTVWPILSPGQRAPFKPGSRFYFL
jgi:hypothetical protein